jgi:uncharacterized protein (TIGR02117 family)
VLFLAGCASEPYALVPSPDLPPPPPRTQRVFAVGHGWHVGFVLPTEGLMSRLPDLKRRFGNADYLEIGWGDKGFYQAPDQEITFAITMQAMFWSGGAVMHVVALPPSRDAPFDYFTASDIVELCVTDRELAALNKYVADSFLKDEQNQPIAMKRGIYGDGQFYEATGRFHLLNTCNKWVATGLSRMGLSIDPTFKLTSASVLDWLRDSGRAGRRGRNGVVITPYGHAEACTATRRE